jgi:hypothetical protein
MIQKGLYSGAVCVAFWERTGGIDDRSDRRSLSENTGHIVTLKNALKI